MDRTPGDLLADELTDLVGRAGIPHAEHIQGLIRWAGYQLDCSLVGEHLFRTPADLPFPPHISGYASLNLVFRCAVTCLDLCAAAVFWIGGGTLQVDAASARAALSQVLKAPLSSSVRAGSLRERVLRSGMLVTRSSSGPS